MKRFFCTLLLTALLFMSLCTAAPLTIRAEGENTDADRQSVILAEVDQMEEQKQFYMDAGFPSDYAQRLAALHFLHPNWTFSPLSVTELNEDYTWDYVQAMETKNPKTNLVSASDPYVAYRHAQNTERYDSGWYQASAETVAYFMDPRNFLNEKDIFQFQDLAYSDSAVTADIIETALAGTFMANTTLENGKTYAQYLVDLGAEIGIDPIHLAARVRQEQGVTAGVLVSGECGDRLAYYYKNKTQEENGKLIKAPTSGYTEGELLAYNGLYNYFNIGAAGTGYFQIYLGAMKEAKNGTADMADTWGDAGAWNTRWKALYGGAYTLYEKYISKYQNTLYLQKFNVDARSGRNFWGQYMQNISGAFSEARTFYNSLSACDCLDLPFHFLIPVYDDMPTACSADPANGTCARYVAADAGFTTLSGLLEPTEIVGTQNNPFFGKASVSVLRGDTWSVHGFSVSTSALGNFTYSLDGGAWQEAESEKNADICTAYKAEYKRSTTGRSKNAYTVTLDTADLGVGAHTLAVRASVSGMEDAVNHYLCAYLTFTVAEPPETTAPETDKIQETTEPEQTTNLAPALSEEATTDAAGTSGCGSLLSVPAFVLCGILLCLCGFALLGQHKKASQRRGKIK